MFRKLFGVGLLVLLIAGLFGGFSGRRTQSAYYEGYSDGLQAGQSVEGSETAAETSAPPAAPYRDGYGHGRYFGWGILGIFAFFFKAIFMFFLFMFVLRLIFGRRWRHRGGPWGRGSWRFHKHGHGGHRPGWEKSPKWTDDDDDDEPIMTV